MSFFEHDLALPWWFGLLCWNFALAGLLMLWTEPRWVQQTPVFRGYTFPYKTLALLLIFLQAPLSFMADYVHMEHESYWHAADRCLAVPLMTCELVKYLLQCRESWRAFQQYCSDRNAAAAMQPWMCGLYGLGMMAAVFCFAQSAAAQEALHRDHFVYWHSAWHLYPLVVSAIILIDFYACQGWKRSARQYLYAAELHLLKRVE
jgi:hypothetical protein